MESDEGLKNSQHSSQIRSCQLKSTNQQSNQKSSQKYIDYDIRNYFKNESAVNHIINKKTCKKRNTILTGDFDSKIPQFSQKISQNNIEQQIKSQKTKQASSIIKCCGRIKKQAEQYKQKWQSRIPVTQLFVMSKSELPQHALVIQSNRLRLVYADPATFKAQAIWVSLNSIKSQQSQLDISQSQTTNKTLYVKQQGREFELLYPGAIICNRETQLDLRRDIKQDVKQMFFVQSTNKLYHSCYMFTKLLSIEQDLTNSINMENRQLKDLKKILPFTSVLYEVLQYSKIVKIKDLVIPYLFRQTTPRASSLMFKGILRILQHQKFSNARLQVTLCMRGPQQFFAFQSLFSKIFEQNAEKRSEADLNLSQEQIGY